jgi:4-aminobutyrate aminotransferase-like enzyme
MREEALFDRRMHVLGRYAPLFYDRPLHVVRGEGVWLFDADGRRYLDAYNNVPHVGHCNARVVEAICRQAATLNVHTRYLDENVVRYAERLTASLDSSLSTALFCCSGSEANELALRIARHCTQGKGVIVTGYTYHGNTASVFDLSTAFNPPEKRSSYVRAISALDCYRDLDDESEAQLSRRYAAEVQRQIAAFAADNIKLAGMLVCCAFSSEGLPNLPPGFMAQAAQHVHNAGGVFIADEVQAGFGRLGTHMWGHQVLGVRPDIVTMGKPMGNGHPVAAVVTTAHLAEEFGKTSMYFNTFGGNPVSCAAGMAVLDVLCEDNLQRNALQVGGYLVRGLNQLQEHHECIGDVRGKGLFIAVELVLSRSSKIPASALAKRVINAMRERGVLISCTGPHDNVLKIRPPMPFARENADQLLETLDTVLQAAV